jgi:hypothetical protein
MAFLFYEIQSYQVPFQVPDYGFRFQSTDLGKNRQKSLNF